MNHYKLVITYFLNLKEHNQFALLLSFVMFLLGIYWYSVPIASNHLLFFISAPLASYFPAKLLWKITFKHKKHYTYFNLIGLSVILTMISIYLNFFILDIIEFIKHQQIETLLNSITLFSMLRIFIAIYYIGLISIASIFITGLFIFKLSNKNK